MTLREYMLDLERKTFMGSGDGHDMVILYGWALNNMNRK